jgi:hypothetical protein
VGVDADKLKYLAQEKFAELKYELFQSNGSIFGRDWHDLERSYKKKKAEARGSAYPIQVYDGDLLNSLTENALKVEVTENENLGTISITFDVDSSRVHAYHNGFDYAEVANEHREFISLSDEEKIAILGYLKDNISEWWQP